MYAGLVNDDNRRCHKSSLSRPNLLNNVFFSTEVIVLLFDEGLSDGPMGVSVEEILYSFLNVFFSLDNGFLC